MSGHFYAIFWLINVLIKPARANTNLRRVSARLSPTLGYSQLACRCHDAPRHAHGRGKISSRRMRVPSECRRRRARSHAAEHSRPESTRRHARTRVQLHCRRHRQCGKDQSHHRGQGSLARGLALIRATVA